MPRALDDPIVVDLTRHFFVSLSSAFLGDVIHDEQAWRNRCFTKSYCEEVQKEVEIRGIPVTLSKTPGELHTLGPQLGQDTELLLVDLFGYGWDAIDELKTKGVIL